MQDPPQACYGRQVSFLSKALGLFIELSAVPSRAVTLYLLLHHLTLMAISHLIWLTSAKVVTIRSRLLANAI